MAIYSFVIPDAGSLTPFTPTAGVANWVLESTTALPPAGQRRLIRFEWGSEHTTGNGVMRTRIARDSAVGTGTRTTLTLERPDIILADAIASEQGTYAVSTYGTTQPTVANGSLFTRAWHVGGGVQWEAPPGGGFTVYGLASIECRQDVGAFDSTYGGEWEE